VEKELLLTCEHIYKSFGPTKALVDMELHVSRGEIRGLIGENGSGKSTLSSIIAGAQKFDSGKMVLRGEEYSPIDMVDAQNKGIGMVVQEMGTISNISVAANILIGKEKRFQRGTTLNLKKMNQEAQDILNQIGASHIRADMPVDAYNLEDRKLIEIARALYDEPEILIIDETTTALSENGRNMLYGIMKDLCDRQKAVLFISHDLDELMRICNAITIMRDGVLITTMDKKDMNVQDMRTQMVGREISDDYYRTDYDGSYSEEVVLQAEHVSNGDVLQNISFELHKGEILGIAGLSECGMHELGRALFGADRLLTGKVTLADGTVIENERIAISHGIAYASKNRDQESIVLNDTIQNNIALPSLSAIARHGYISPKLERRVAKEGIERLKIKCESGNQYVSELSGGNKQKVVFAKWIENQSDILILDCPTRGIDIGVKVAMYKLIYQMKQEGKAIVMISEELAELIGMIDRMLVLKDGKITKTFRRSPDLKETDIIHYMI
jgi:ribose transport system ATP-binding protein